MGVVPPLKKPQNDNGNKFVSPHQQMKNPPGNPSKVRIPTGENGGSFDPRFQTPAPIRKLPAKMVIRPIAARTDNERPELDPQRDTPPKPAEGYAAFMDRCRKKYKAHYP